MRNHNKTNVTTVPTKEADMSDTTERASINPSEAWIVYYGVELDSMSTDMTWGFSGIMATADEMISFAQ